MKIKVKKVGENRGFCVEHYRGVDNKHFYVKRFDINDNFIDWYSATKEWEPDCPIKKDVEFVVVK